MVKNGTFVGFRGELSPPPTGSVLDV